MRLHRFARASGLAESRAIASPARLSSSARASNAIMIAPATHTRVAVDVAAEDQVAERAQARERGEGRGGDDVDRRGARTPAMIVGTASGSSTRATTCSPRIPMPRAASTALRSTWLTPTYELVRIGGIPSTARAKVTLSQADPDEGGDEPRSAPAPGTARPALPTEIATASPRRKWPSATPMGSAITDCEAQGEEGHLEVLAGQMGRPDRAHRPSSGRCAPPAGGR